MTKNNYLSAMFKEYLTLSALLIFCMMSFLFLVASMKKDNSIIDIFWGIGFILICFSGMLADQVFTAKHILLNSLIVIWGLRLSIHIWLRNRGKGEDFRYRNWRENWTFFYFRSFLQIFMLQGFLMLIIATPVILVNSSPDGSVGLLEIVGAIILLTGLLFESLGDYQLAKFRQNPDNKGVLMTTGLWQYTRHPNYFGEAVVWTGVWLMAIPEVDGLFTIVSPLLMYVLLRYVSGVPMLEKKLQGRPDWEAYAANVPPFFPRFRNKI